MIKPKILVAHDYEFICSALKFNLERAGYDISITQNGETALTLLKEQSYDLLLTDYQVPGINGLELMQQAKELYPKVKVIISSGFAEGGLPENFLALGADHFLHKPIKILTLLKLIQNILPPQTMISK